MGELNGEDCTCWSNNIRNVGYRGSACGTEVEDFCSWAYEDLVETTEDTSGKLFSLACDYSLTRNAPTLDLNGFQTRYSVFVAGGAVSPLEAVLFMALDSTEMRFSP